MLILEIESSTRTADSLRLLRGFKSRLAPVIQVTITPTPYASLSLLPSPLKEVTV